MRIVTWNVNSVRLRTGLMRRLCDALHPDVLCLQETKVEDALFPPDLPADIGLPHVIVRGMKSYNGVAVLSRHALTALGGPDWCGRGDCRHLAVGLTPASGRPLTVHNFYVPAGGDVPDPALNPKFRHKLDFMAEAAAWFEAHPPSRAVLVGDLNVAPLEHDVWSHRQLRMVVSHTEPEITALDRWRAAGFHDAVRHFVPASEKLYTWWSYRNRDWRASDRGRRLDHVWISDDLRSSPRRFEVLKEARDWEPCSDHVPVMVELA